MTARLMIGDVRARINEIPDGSVDLICTSPPFLALRKYGDNPEGEMGSEATPAEFIDGLLSLTAEFRRVLAPHGSIGVELGDTYCGAAGYGRPDSPNPAYGAARFGERWEGRTVKRFKKKDDGWPLAKSLCLTPYAYPMALAYGRNPLTGQPSPAGQWMVRNMIAWARPNPPVGELADKVRPGTSYITVATTSPRRWFDLDAVRSEPTGVNYGRQEGWNNVAPGEMNTNGRNRADEWRPYSNPAGAPPLDWWDDDYDPADPVDAYTLGHMTLVQATQPYKGAHYATWPKALAQRLILMMCPPKVCTICGVPSERIVETERIVHGTQTPSQDARQATAHREPLRNFGGGSGDFTVTRTELGWTECDCTVPNKWRQGCVLDPFAGSGTTLAVATGCGRDAIGVELYEQNAHLIRERVGMFLEES